MNIELEINNIAQSSVKDGFFKDVAEKTFNEIGYYFLEDKKVSISIALVSEKEIRKLNKEYRKKDSVTDILSFPEYEDLKNIKKDANRREVFLGELILCYNDVKEYSQEEGIKLEKELANVFSHGMLHLLGFKHGKKMFEIQERISNKY